MLTTHKFFGLVFVVLFSFLLSGCINFGNNNSTPTVGGVTVSNNSIIINGSNLSSVTDLAPRLVGIG